MNVSARGISWRSTIARLVLLVAICALASCGLAREIQERQFQALQNTCAAYGAGPGTPGYTDCMLRLHSEQAAEQEAQAQRNEQIEEENARRMQEVNEENLRAFSRPIYVQPMHTITCTPMGYGTTCQGY